ncbi:CRE-MUS-101 protein [Caenorhabditis remanei]|uniref:CRE-MUS-101 protein n=1 Tax=Caenorhabditis remanei TaxID=31234 RepID=E3LW19_CAERE|nr:CRE-MUS-101 protein [Caenorhabditis remanei]
MSVPPAPKKSRRNESNMIEEDSVICDDDNDDSSCTMYFVKLPDGKPTEQEDENFLDAYNIAKDSGVMPEWMDSESLDRIQSSDDFFIVPCFRGKLFRRMLEKKFKIYGPPILRECIDEQKPLPLWNHPVFSSVFEGAKLTLTSFEPEKKLELYQKIGWMCGIASGDLYHETTHLLASRAEQTNKYKSAVSNSVKLMRKEWVEELWETSQTTMGKFSALSRDAVNSYRLRVFEGLEMAITSIDGTDRANLMQLVEEHGGKVYGNMSKPRCTHLISDKTSGKKYTKAVEWKTIKIVQTRWIRKCIDLGHLIDETKYHPKYLTAEHMRSSTPKKNTTVNESVPDVSAISGNGGRLCTSSFNVSSAMTPVDKSSRRQSGSYVSTTSTSIVASTTIMSTDITIGRTSAARKHDQLYDFSYRMFFHKYQVSSSTPLARQSSIPLARIPTTQSISTQDPADSALDPIDELRKLIDEGHSDLFEVSCIIYNCLFYICGVDEKRMEKWRRFLNETGATRAPKFESATNVVVIAPNQQERMALRKFMQQEDIAIVTAQWVVECVKRRTMVPADGFVWTENIMDESQWQSQNDDYAQTGMSQPNKTSSIEFIFANHTYGVHPSSFGRDDAKKLSENIRELGGQIERTLEKAEFVVFGHSATMHELLVYDTVVTDFYIDSCRTEGYRAGPKKHPLFVPLPKPPIQIFSHCRFFLICSLSSHSHLCKYVGAIIRTNGGAVIDEMDSKAYKIMITKGPIDEPQHRARTADYSWIIASVSRGSLLPINNYLYKENAEPLLNFQRDDDVWMKIQERDTTEELEQEIEDRHKVQDKPVQTREGKKTDLSTPYVNPYFPDLRKPYKMNLNLDNANEYIDNMESPARDTQESITNSRVGSILRKAVINTGRRTEKENEPATCQVLNSRVAMTENRRTVSSTPVLVREIDRAARYMAMDESFAEQNQEHEELNRQYAMQPRFLLSVSSMNPQEIQELQEAIKQLGGRIEKEYNRDVTHLIASNMQRTPKVLCSIAAGKWCLTPDYVTQSTASGRWIDEKRFEWSYDKLPKVSEKENHPKDRDNRKILEKLVSVCRLWRTKIEQMPITSSVSMESRVNGAFTGWRCVIHEEDKKTLQVASILEAGGAVVYYISEYIQISSIKPNRVFAFKDFNWNIQSAAMLKRDNMPLYIIEIIYEYLVDKDNLDCSKYLHSSYKRAC